MVAYRWSSDKIGDKAEEATFNFIADQDFCKLLGRVRPIHLKPILTDFGTFNLTDTDSVK